MKRILGLTIFIVLGTTLLSGWPKAGATQKSYTTALVYHFIHNNQPNDLKERYFVTTPKQLKEELTYLKRFNYPTILVLRKNDPETIFYVDQLIKPSGLSYLWFTYPTYRTFTPEILIPALPPNPPANGSYPVIVREVSATAPLSDFGTILPNRYLNNDCFFWVNKISSCQTTGALLSILLFGFGILALIYPLFIVATVMAFLPFYQLRLAIFGAPFTLLELLMLTSIVAWLPQVLANLKRILKTVTPLTTLFLLTLISLGLALFTQNASLTSFGYARAFFLIPIAWTISSLVILKDENSLFWPSLGYLLGAGIVSLATLYRFTQGDFYTNFDGQIRATFFGNPNHLAAYLSPAVLLGIGLSMKRKVFLLLLVLLFTFVLILTWSKGALLGTAAGLAYLYLRPKISSFRKTNSALVVGTFGCVLTLQFIIATIGSYTTFTNYLKTTESSNASRIAVYQTSMILLSNSPIFGIGLANFHEQFQATVSHASPEQDTAFAHNIFLDVWLQLGILGLYVLFLWVMGAFQIPVLESYSIQSWAIIFQAVLLSRLVHGLVDSIFLKNDFAVLIIFLIGTLWWLNRRTSNQLIVTTFGSAVFSHKSLAHQRMQ